jgi:hypothetical protein
MGARRPATCSNNQTPRGLAFQLSTGIETVQFCERCTEDILSAPTPNSSNLTSSRNVDYCGDQDSLLLIFPNPFANPTFIGDLTIGRGYSVYMNDIDGAVSPSPPGMSFVVPSSDTAFQARYRNYDRGNCSWLLPSDAHGALQAVTLDTFLASKLPEANAVSSCSIALFASGPWTIEHSIIGNGRAQSGDPPRPSDTTDRVRFSRTYSLWEPGTFNVQTLQLRWEGRYNASTGQLGVFPGTINFFSSSGSELQYLCLGGDYQAWKTRIQNLIIAQLGSHMASQFSALRSQNSLPPPTRFQLYPTGLELVLSEVQGDGGDVSLASHPNRANYCGAQRAMPFALSGSPGARTGQGTNQLINGWTW